jgi:hypothetical protein
MALPGKKSPTSRRPSGGSASNSPTFSYYANRSREGEQSRSPASEARSKFLSRRWVKNLPSLIALSAVLLSIIWCLGLTTTPKIILSMPSSTDKPLRDKKDYQNGATEILNQSFFNRSKLTINTDAFTKAFMDKYPEVADVSVSLPLISRRPVISVDTAEPVVVLASNNQLYALDKRGKAIMKAEELQAETRKSLPIVSDESGLSVNVGKTVLPSDEIQFITTVLAQLKAKNIPVQSITLPAAAKEMYLRVEGQKYYVKFNFASDARVAVGSFLAVKAKLEQTNVTPAEYIDVRIDERAYYK